jgi:O-acetyl-ADP-ribose deacetylase (regulator of RNase III)
MPGVWSPRCRVAARRQNDQMTLFEADGNLFELDFPAIGHGCNTKGLMGAGIAVEFKRRYPEMYSRYVRECHAGHFQLGDVLVWVAEDKVIYNLATQARPGPWADLDAIEHTVSAALVDAHTRKLGTVGIPRIGSGLGGLTWPQVRPRLVALAEASG